MTIAHKLPARNKYKCDICGKVSFWGPKWMRYSSIALDETCPDDVPTVCGEDCMAILNYRLKTGAIKLPELDRSNGYFCTVVKDRVGY